MHDKIHPHLFAPNFAFELTDFTKSPRSPCCVLCKNLATDFIIQGLSHYMISRFLLFSLSFATACHSFTPSLQDVFCFGKLWKHLEKYQDEQKLESVIAERRAAIKELKQHWKERLDSFPAETHRDFYQSIQLILQRGTLERMQEGSGAAHLLSDEKGIPRFILKPVDGEMLCLNNSKYYGNPLHEIRFRARPDIPLYYSVQTDALVYECAATLGLSSIVPKTVLAVVASDVFYDLSERLEETDKEKFFLLTGPVDRERLCSVQEYIPHSQEFSAWYRKGLSQGFSQEQIADLIQQEDFENIHLLIWIIYDNDAHLANIRVIQQEEEIFRLVKIDSGLSFPERNTHLLNALSLLPNAHKKLSHRAQDFIAALPIEELVDLLNRYEMQHAIPAFLERVHVLKELAQRSLTLFEINAYMEQTQTECE